MQNKDIYLLKTLDETQKLAEKVVDLLSPWKKRLVFLYGNLGSGKTTLTQMILHRFGWTGRVKSPSYSLIEPYHIAEQQIYHLDLYRIQNPEELYFMGLTDLLSENAFFFIEWPEVLAETGINAEIKIFLELNSANNYIRTARIEYV